MKNKIKRKIVAIITAGQAGNIVRKCTTGCYTDDEREEIFACIIHEPEIARLAKMNEENN